MFKPYSYKKKYKFDILQPFRKKNRPNITILHLIAFSTTFIGAYLLVGWVLYPLITIHAEANSSYPIIDPLYSAPSLSKRYENGFIFNELDYMFRDSDSDGSIALGIEQRTNVPTQFYITIPKLEIYDAIIQTNSETLDPDTMLGHYKGTCLPDEACNVFVYGHSTHKWAKNRYEKGDYTGIFSKLDELVYGDEIFINFNNKEYKYIVDSSIIKNPEDVDPLAQPYPKSLGVHDNTLELFTCTPAGSTKYRLSVLAKQIK